MNKICNIKFLSTRALFIVLSCILFSVNVVAKDIVAIPESISFGNVRAEDGSLHTSFLIVNESVKRYVILSATIQNDFGDIFSFPGPQLPLEVTGNNQRPHSLSIRCNPLNASVGRHTALLQLAYIEDGEDKTDTLEIPLEVTVSRGQQPNNGNFAFFVPKLLAGVGDTLLVPVIVRQAPPALPVGVFTIGLSWNASLLTPEDPAQRGRIIEGIHTVTYIGSANRVLRPGDTLFAVRMIALLGDVPATPIIFSGEFRLNQPGGGMLQNPIYPTDGSFELINVFYDGNTPRLITPDPEQITIAVFPNPSQNDVQLTVEYQGRALLQIFDISGRVIEDISGRLPLNSVFAARTISLPRVLFPRNGLYFARLAVGSQTVTTLIHRL